MSLPRKRIRRAGSFSSWSAVDAAPTTLCGPETRHGVVEFQLPPLGGRVTQATLHFTDVHGWQPIEG